jgi:hypothetical protein
VARRWRTRLAAAVAALAVVPLLSGCVAFLAGSLHGNRPQDEVIGDVPLTLTVCASGSSGNCPPGISGVPAVSGTGQILLGLRLPDQVTMPSSFTSTGPEALAFTESLSYAAELQRLDPAEPGTRWRGFISAVANYATASGPQSITLEPRLKLGRGADGGPFGNELLWEDRIGARAVHAAAPGSRPVVCGPSLTTIHDEDPSMAVDIYVICTDDGGRLSGGSVRDLGVLNGASGSGPPGGVEVVPFAVRYAGTGTSAADFRLTAATTLPGATVAVTPATLVPASNSTHLAQVAVGIPPGARPGRYDVTLTARLANGQTRAGTGTLTVLPGAAVAGGGPAARLRLTTILPRRLSARIARKRGIAVLIGATKAGLARVQLFQGRGRAPKATKRVRPRVPGPIRVVLRSAKLRKGPYGIVIRADNRTFVRRAVLTR